VSIVGSIDILFWRPPPLTKIVAALLADGWTGWNDTLAYEVYDRPEEYPGEEDTCPLEQWPQAVATLSEEWGRGRYVGVHLYDGASDGAMRASLTFHGMQVSVHLDGSRPTLPVLRYTDFSAVLVRLLPAFEASGCGVLEVRCTDDAR